MVYFSSFPSKIWVECIIFSEKIEQNPSSIKRERQLEYVSYVTIIDAGLNGRHFMTKSINEQ